MHCVSFLVGELILVNCGALSELPALFKGLLGVLDSGSFYSSQGEKQ